MLNFLKSVTKIQYLYNACGIAYRHLGDYRAATADFDAAIRFVPPSSIAFRERGHVYVLRGNFIKALPDFDQAIKINPFYAILNGYRSVIYYGEAPDWLALGSVLAMRRTTGATRARLVVGSRRMASWNPLPGRCSPAQANGSISPRARSIASSVWRALSPTSTHAPPSQPPTAGCQA